jgi:hypothetical protein
MSPRSAPSTEPVTGGLIAQRYRLLATLGGGGMAKVYAALDTATGREIALKRPTLEGSPEHQRRVADLFSREYHAMSQLAHPRIVEVYDYGVDADGPYYTMEILEGGDLNQLVPVPHRRLCEIARAVCSALSLLHSRRIVHRDVNPRNLRFTAAGVVKLIDFGAMTAMAPSKEIAGTPAFCAPEVLSLQALDARTDLYALGATLYYALTGRHAYPARDFVTLQRLWHVPVARPSDLVTDVPEALDALVLDLLHLDVNHRPSNAADVVDRLLAIEGRTDHDADEQLVVAQSYLATPTFVGRGEELSRAQSGIASAMRERGCVLLVTGARGAGRTRFLEACLLDAKLHGYMGLRADAEDAASGDYGILRRLLTQLQQMRPDLARELLRPMLPVLGHVMPDLLDDVRTVLESFPHPALLRDAVQTAIGRVLVGAAEQVPLLLAIDDIQRSDEPSMAVLALLSQAAEHARIVIIASAVEGELDETAASIKLLVTNASTVRLPNLTLQQTAELLASIFGSSAELAPLTNRLHALSFGRPRDLMRLAQHLVDRGLARYSAGAWSLPGQLDTHDLPASVAQLMSDRVASIDAEARQLGRALALCPELAFTFAEARRLGGQANLSQLMRDVDELTRLDIARLRVERVELNDRAWISPLLTGLGSGALCTLHLNLAGVLEERGDDPFRQARHLLRGGEKLRAIDVFVAHAIESRKQTSASPSAFRRLIAGLPDDWYETYDEFLRACDEFGRPKRDAFAIRARLGGIVSIKARNDRVHLPYLIAQVEAASGLTDYSQMDPAIDPDTRLLRALEAASARYDAMPDHERVVPPKQAMQYLAMGLPFMVPVAAPVLDLAMLRALPCVAPLVPVVPALGVAESLRVGVIGRVSGRYPLALQTYHALLDRLNAPDGGGLEPTHVTYARLQVEYAIALLEATMGLAACIQRAERMVSEPLLRVNAAVVRMLYALWQGDSESGDRERRHIEELRIRTGATATDQTHLLSQLAAYAAMDDLTRLKRTLLDIAPIAEKHLGWRHVEAYGKAEYQRIRGDYAAANAVLVPWLADNQAGELQMWALLAATHIRALSGVGQRDQAIALGRAYLDRARTAELGFPAEHSIIAAFAVAQVQQGETEAVAELEAAIRHTLDVGTTGIPLGVLYEARAYVALYQGDLKCYGQFVQLCEQELLRHTNPALAARLQRLKREARRRQETPALPHSPQPGAQSLSLLRSRLDSCADAAERAAKMLDLLAQRSGASEGLLFQVQETGPAWVASIGKPPPDPTLDALIKACLEGETRKQQATSLETTLAQDESYGSAKLTYRSVILSHYIDSRYCVTGIAVFVIKPGEPFTYPAEAATQVSTAAYALGDSVGVFLEDEP